MSKPLPTRIELDTKILSAIVSDILAEIGAPSTKKSACLNIAARKIAGVKHNWGYLTGATTRIVAQGLEMPPREIEAPDYVIAGAALALKDHPLTPPDLAEDLAPLVASIYLNDLPAALDVFKTTKEVYHDLVHNRGEIVGFVAGHAHRSEQLNQEMREGFQRLGLLDKSVPATDPAQKDRPWGDILADKIKGLKPVSSYVRPSARHETPSSDIRRDLDFRMEDFIAFLRKKDATHPIVCDFLEENADCIEEAIRKGHLTPADWNRIAILAKGQTDLDPDASRMVEIFTKAQLPMDTERLMDRLKQK